MSSLVLNVLKTRIVGATMNSLRQLLVQRKPISVGNQLGMIQRRMQLGSKLVVKLGTGLNV